MKLTCCLLSSLFLPFPTSSITRRLASVVTTRLLAAIPNAHHHAPEFGGSAVELDCHCWGCRSNVLSDALQVFDELPDRGVVSATSLIGRLAKQNCHKEATLLFSRIVERNIKPNEFTFGTVIHSSVVLKDLALGKQFHACAVKMGLYSNVFVGGALVDLYVKFRNIEEARQVFEDHDQTNVFSCTAMINGYFKEERFDEAVLLFKKMPERNVVSWNAMISGCCQTGKNEEAVEFFVQMLREGYVPDDTSFPCTIIAAANVAALGMGRSVHACAVKFLGRVSLFVSNSLISFYAKCGSMEDSLAAFHKLPVKNVVSWNAVVCGLAQNGMANEALDMFQKMKSSGFRPNGVTLLGLLLACNHVGLVDEGYSYFNQVRLEEPSMIKAEHYACVVDLFSRSGRFQEAVKFMADLPFNPGIGFWKAILGGCHIHSNVELGAFAAEKIRALDPGDVASFVMLSNAHSAAGRWRSASALRNEMLEKGMNRVPGCSWIEVKNAIHVFVNGDKSHPERVEMTKTLRFLLEQMIGIHEIDLIT